jgi:hypothetical protein
MDRDEAYRLLGEHLEGRATEDFESLAALVGDPQVTQRTGESGIEYQIEVEALWDHESRSVLRVLGSIDDGSLRSAFRPITDDFLIDRDGVVGPDEPPTLPTP